MRNEDPLSPRLVRETASAPFDVQAVSVPEKVMMSVCREQTESGPELLIHLLNATGTGVAKGQAMPRHVDWTKRGAAFPALKEDLVFDLRCAGVRTAQIASPDYEGTRPVEATPRDADTVWITVRAADFLAYAIVRVRLVH